MNYDVFEDLIETCVNSDEYYAYADREYSVQKVNCLISLVDHSGYIVKKVAKEK